MLILNFNWNGHATWMYTANLCIVVAYNVGCKHNYGYHNQTRFLYDIFLREHFSAVKFAMDYDKKYELSRDSKL